MNEITNEKARTKNSGKRQPRSYYYDDAHGYQNYIPDDEDDESSQTDNDSGACKNNDEENN